MFDVNQRLIICNQRFLDLYSLPAAMAQPGTELGEILDHTVRMEKLPPEHARALRQRRLSTAASLEEATVQDFLSNGRRISARQSVVWGKRVTGRLDNGGRRHITK